MKKKLLRIAAVVCLLVSVMCLGQMSVFAVTNKENDEVVLHYQLAADDSFKFYISDSDTEKGNLIKEGTKLITIYEGDTKLKVGKTYYLHIEAFDTYAYEAAIAGYFTLEGDSFSFNNNSNKIATNVNDFKVSKTGFGKDYLNPTIVKQNDYYDALKLPAQWIWTNHGEDFHCTRYFSTTITPKFTSPSSLKATSGDSKVDLTWNAVIDATSYTIKRSTTAGGPYTTIATGITDTTYADTDVTNGTTYYYVVTATVNGSESENSNEASATPTGTAGPGDSTTPGDTTNPGDPTDQGDTSDTSDTVDNKLKVVLEVGEKLQLSVDDDLDENADMSWTSSDTSVATVNGNGVVTALAPGNTKITVTSEDGTYTDYINVLVVEDADDYRLAVDLKVGQTSRLTIDDLTDTVKVKWVSMDSSIAKVSSKGKVKAVSEGLALVTALDKDGNIIGKVYVRVRE